MSDNKPLTYISYLKLEELLQLQAPLSDGPEHDELLFIVIHQVYELWFKQVLHELDALSEALDEQDAARALAALKRVLTIFKTLVSQVDILETMTPMSSIPSAPGLRPRAAFSRPSSVSWSFGSATSAQR